MPPFGNLYNMKVLMDANLLADERIVFNAGTHRDVIHLSQEDYRRLVQPEVVHLAREVVMHSALVIRDRLLVAGNRVDTHPIKRSDFGDLREGVNYVTPLCIGQQLARLRSSFRPRIRPGQED